MTMVATDGHRLSMVESDMPFPALGCPFPGAAAAEGDGRDSEAGRGSGAGCHDPVLGRRESPVFPVGRPAAEQPQADRQLPGLRARLTERAATFGRRCERDELRRPSSAFRQFSDERSRAIRLQFRQRRGASSTRRSRKPERARRALPVGVYRATRCRSVSTPQYLLDFLRAVAGEAGVLPLPRSPSAPANCGPRGDGAAQYQYRYVVMPMRI